MYCVLCATMDLVGGGGGFREFRDAKLTIQYVHSLAIKMYENGVLKSPMKTFIIS